MLAKAFARAGAKQDETGRSLIDAIKRERPDLKRKSFYPPEYGSTSHVFIAGNEIFKGPRFVNDIADMDAEYHNLLHLQGRGLLVPEITCRGKDTVFYGMKRAEGVVLERVFGDLTPQQEMQLAVDLGTFIAGMAGAFDEISVKTAVEDGYNVDSDGILERMDGNKARKNLGADYDFCKDEITDYYRRMKERKLIARHSDLHPENILVDGVSRKLTCITDFGKVNHVLAEDSLGMLVGWLKPQAIEQAWLAYTRLRTDTDPRELYAARLVAQTLFLNEDMSRSNKEKLAFAINGLKGKGQEPVKKLTGPQC